MVGYLKTTVNIINVMDGYLKLVKQNGIKRPHG